MNITEDEYFYMVQIICKDDDYKNVNWYHETPIIMREKC